MRTSARWAGRCLGSGQRDGHVSTAHASYGAYPPHPITYHADFTINPIPHDHRFPMPKDALLYARLQALGLAARTFTPAVPDEDTLCLVHDRAYVQGFLGGTLSMQELRRIGLPWSPALVQRTLVGVGSAVLAARLALEYGVACMTNGGTHHAHPGHGSGWCIFNDQAVAARALQRDAGVKSILFVDLDVHQGDGTAAIFADDPTVYTLSLHCVAQAFPAALQRSSADVALPAGTTDAQYLEALAEALPAALAAAEPEIVMYNAGVDVHASDSLGLMALTDAGVAARDGFVFSTCATAGVPVMAAIGGGYEADHERIVDRHVLLHQAAYEHLPALGKAARARRRRGKQP